MHVTTKKLIGLVAAAVLASSIAVLAGCSSSGSGSASASGSSASASAASASASAASASASAASASTSAASASAESASASAEIANPWSDAASAEEAAAGAGIDEFKLPEGELADLGEPFEITYHYMDGMAEARYEFPASEVIIRKGKVESADENDITGDYNEYAYEWTTEIGDITLTCAGNREGDSTKTFWGDGDYAYALIAEGLGGDLDFGLNTERLTAFVEGMA